MRTLKVTQNFSYFNQKENKVKSLKIGDVVNDDDPKFQNILDRKHGVVIKVDIKKELPIEEIKEQTPIKIKSKNK